MDAERNWTVLLIGGASGTGKSCLAYALARAYAVNVIEIDDIAGAIEAVTTDKTHPALHYWDAGIDWTAIGVMGNVDWLRRVGEEIAPGLRAVIENHIESGVPVIIEGDFLSPAFCASFDRAGVKALFVVEPDDKQIGRNYIEREGGEPQDFRAQISAAYGGWITDACAEQDIPLIESRPWATVAERAMARLA